MAKATYRKARPYSNYDYELDYSKMSKEQAEKEACEDAESYLGSRLEKAVEIIKECPTWEHVEFIFANVVGIQGLPLRALAKKHCPEVLDR